MAGSEKLCFLAIYSGIFRLSIGTSFTEMFAANDWKPNFSLENFLFNF
jgi:hypothetical protein